MKNNHGMQTLERREKYGHLPDLDLVVGDGINVGHRRYNYCSHHDGDDKCPPK